MCDPGSATPTVMIDNDRVRVTEWRFAKRGDNTGWHRHAYDYVVVPLFDGVLEIDLGMASGSPRPCRTACPITVNWASSMT